MSVHIELAAERHAPAVQLLVVDPAIAAMTNVPHPYPADGAWRWTRQAEDGRAAGTLFAFVIVDDAAGLVGVCSLMGVSRRFGVAELGYWIGRPHWGQGFATEGGRQVLAFGFDGLGLTRITAGALQRNGASRRVLEKLGFAPTGERTTHEKGPGVLYALQRAAWVGGVRDLGV